VKLSGLFKIQPHVSGAVVFMSLVSLLYMITRMVLAIPGARGAAPIIDTQVFLDMSRADLFSAALWAGLRPPVVPLVYKLLGGNFRTIVMVQTLLSISAWLFFAWSLQQWLRSRAVKLFTFTLLLLVASSRPMVVWESCLMSESISISLFIAATGAWLWFIRDGGWLRFTLLFVLSVLWLLSRETNVWLMGLVAVLCLPAGILKKDKKYLFLLAGFSVAFIMSDISSSMGQRWAFPLLNVLSRRILPVDENRAFFERHGMPVTPALIRMTGECASCRDYAYYKDPELASFRTWFYKKGKRTYMSWLLSNPATLMREPLSNIERMVAPGSLFHYAAPGSKCMLPSFLSKLLFPIAYKRYFSLVMVWALVFATGIAVGSGVWRNSGAWTVALLLVLLAYPHLILVWHGDVIGFEMGRHSLAARIQLNVALWCMAALTVDMLVKNITTEDIRTIFEKVIRYTGSAGRFFRGSGDSAS
jgi:hypothetical protein